MTGLATYSHAPWPTYDEEQISTVAAVLQSGRVNYWTGTEGRLFEQEFADFTGVEHAVFVANGTQALELAVGALQLPKGSKVVTTPRTYIASSSAIVRNGLIPVFADVDVESGNITAESIRQVLTDDVSAVVVVHLAGWPAEMHAIRDLCAERNIKLVEDCAQAHGAMIGTNHVGTFGDVAAWSFCQDKIITTGGEGGMVATNDEDIYRRVWEAKDIGRSYDAVYNRQHPPGFRWLHESFGTNARGTEMQAAIGRIQYRRLVEWREQRSANAIALAKHLAEIPGIVVPMPAEPDIVHAFYRLNAYIDLEALADGWTRNEVLLEVGSQYGLPIFSGSCSEIYREKAFVDAGIGPEKPLPNASRMMENSLAFQVHPGLTETDMESLAYGVDQVMQDATSVTRK